MGELQSRSGKRPSMQDVADKAGVSRTTVSLVINEKAGPNIPETTRKKIRQAVIDLGYRRNAIAQGLRSQKTNTIGFVSDVVASTPHAGGMIHGAQQLAWDYGKLLLVVNTNNDPELTQAAVNSLLERQVDGIIYATMYHREVNPPLMIREVPTVLLDCFVADRSLPSVVPNEVQGGYMATRALLAKGHKRVGFVQLLDTVPAVTGRLQGYRNALAEYGIPFLPELVATTFSNDETPEAAWGYELAMKLLTQESAPSAIFCFHDRLAIGVYQAAQTLGLKIPDDLAIVGFDDQRVISWNMRPQLTSMALPHEAMGAWAVEYLMKLIATPDAVSLPAVQHMIDCPLVARDSH